MTAAQDTPAVELAGVEMQFGDFRALNGLDLAIAPGEVLGLLGHNGAGKTTSMKLILGLLAATGGRVRVFGQDPTAADGDQLRRQIGYLPENVSFYPQLSGRETLRYFARLKGVGRQQQDELLEQVGLSDAADRRVKTYSKGMRQRLGVAQALLAAPKLVIFDEPTVGLDPMATRDFYQMVDALKSSGATVILCSHVLPGIEAHIDRAAILGSGKLLAAGSLEQLRAAAALPLEIRAIGRFQGRFDESPWLASLTSSGVDYARINGHQLSLSAPQGEKIRLLRELLAQPEVDDVEVSTPSLEALYAHFDRQQRGQHDGEALQ